jgi:hypothetical protein
MASIVFGRSKSNPMGFISFQKDKHN